MGNNDRKRIWLTMSFWGTVSTHFKLGSLFANHPYNSYWVQQKALISFMSYPPQTERN